MKDLFVFTRRDHRNGTDPKTSHPKDNSVVFVLFCFCLFFLNESLERTTFKNTEHSRQYLETKNTIETQELLNGSPPSPSLTGFN